MTPAKTSTSPGGLMPWPVGQVSAAPAPSPQPGPAPTARALPPCRGRVQKCKLDNKLQLKGRMTPLSGTATQRSSKTTSFMSCLASIAPCPRSAGCTVLPQSRQRHPACLAPHSHAGDAWFRGRDPGASRHVDSLVSGSRAVIVEGAGHTLFREAEQTFDRELRSFARSIANQR